MSQFRNYFVNDNVALRTLMRTLDFCNVSQLNAPRDRLSEFSTDVKLMPYTPDVYDIVRDNIRYYYARGRT